MDLTDIGNSIGSFFSGVGNTINNDVGSFLKQYPTPESFMQKQVVPQVQQRVVQPINNAVQPVGNAIQNFGQQQMNAMPQRIQSFKTGLNQGVQELGNEANSAARVYNWGNPITQAFMPSQTKQDLGIPDVNKGQISSANDLANATKFALTLWGASKMIPQSLLTNLVDLGAGALTGGAFNKIQGGSFSQGAGQMIPQTPMYTGAMDIGSKIVAPLTKYIAPQAVQQFGQYFKMLTNPEIGDAAKGQIKYLIAKNLERVAPNAVKAMIDGSVGMGLVGATESAKNVNQWLDNISKNAQQGATFAGVTAVGGPLADLGFQKGKAAYNSIPNKEAGFIRIPAESPTTPPASVGESRGVPSTGGEIGGVTSPENTQTQVPPKPLQGTEPSVPVNATEPVNPDIQPKPLKNIQISSEPSADSIPQKQRGFVQSVKDIPITNPAQEINPQTYTPLSNKESFGTAQSRIDTQGVDAAHQYVLSNAPYDAEKAATGQLLMQKYAENINQPGNYEKFQQITDSIDNQARTAGQGIQSLSNWDKMSPQAVLNVANASADKVGQELPQDFQKQIISRATDIQKMAEGPDRTQAVQGLLQDIANQLPPTKGEIFNSFRYANMLSSPVTVERIGYGGLFNDLVTRPISLFAEATTQHLHQAMDSSFERTVSYSDIPQWYKDSYLGMSDAYQAAMQGWKTGGSEKAFQEGTSGQSTINILRKENLPEITQLPMKVHSFIYNFFSSVIGGAERERLIANGIDPTTATEQAKALGDKFTLRSPLGQKDQSAAVQAVDGMGQMAMKMQDIPVLGNFARWIAPFMKVSTNFVKLGVEYSPLSLPDTAVNFVKGTEGADTNFAHAALGSMLSGIGTVLAMKGLTVGALPTDKTQSDLAYAKGMKPYSININGNYIPYQYFGPLGLAMMLPQMVKDGISGQNAPKDLFTKVENSAFNITKAIVAGTPLASITNFLRMVSGDTTVNPATVSADLVSQFVPGSALLRYVAQAIDPVFRDAKTFTQRLESGIPGMTQGIPAYTTPLGQPETRNASNYIAPYTIGQDNPQFTPAFNSRQNTLNSNAIINQANKNAQGGGTIKITGGQVAPGITSLPDGTFAYQMTDENGQTTIKQAKTQAIAQAALDKNNFITSGKDANYTNGVLYTLNDDGSVSTKKVDLTKQVTPPTMTGNSVLDKKAVSDYNSQLTSQASAIYTLYKNGQLSETDASAILDQLAAQKGSTAAPKKVTISKISSPKLTIGKLPTSKVSNVKIANPPSIKMSKIKAPKAVKITPIKIAKLKGLTNAKKLV